MSGELLATLRKEMRQFERRVVENLLRSVPKLPETEPLELPPQTNRNVN